MCNACFLNQRIPRIIGYWPRLVTNISRVSICTFVDLSFIVNDRLIKRIMEPGVNPPVGYYKGMKLLKTNKFKSMQLRKQYIYKCLL